MGKDDRLVGREQRIEITVGQPVRVLVVRLQGHQVDNVDNADPEIGNVMAQQIDRGQGLELGWRQRPRDFGFTMRGHPIAPSIVHE